MNRTRAVLGALTAAAALTIAACGGTDDAPADTAPTPTIDRPATDTAPEPEPTTEEPTEPAVTAADVEQALLDAYAVADFTETCETGSWACYITDVDVIGSTIVVHLQTDDRALGAQAADAITTLLPADVLEPFGSVQTVDMHGGQLAMARLY